MTSLQAWLLDFGNGHCAATSLGTVLHVIEDAALFHVPLAPAHCNRLLLWQGRVLPVTHVPALLGETPDSSRREYPCIVGWREAHGASGYGVLLLQGMPRRIAISDADVTEPGSQDAARWREVALGFFSYLQRVVPIVDVAPFFGAQQCASEAVDRAHLIA